MTERAPLLPALLAGGVGAVVVVIITAMIFCGPDGCSGPDDAIGDPAAPRPILPPHCITMPDGARLCDAPPSTRD